MGGEIHMIGPAIRIRGLRATYPGRRPTAIFDGLDLDVARGECLALIGRSGAGKSTLLKVLAGHLRPAGGLVEAFGEPVAGPDPRRVMMFQQGSLFPWLTAAENVAFALRGVGRAGHRARAADLLAGVGLAGQEDRYPRELSGGMCQRVEYARAMAAGAELLLLDEPFGALDSLTREAVSGALDRLRREAGITILLSTHDLDEAVRLADRVVVVGGRPAGVQASFTVDLPVPRTPDDPRYDEMRRRLLNALRETAAANPVAR